MPYKTPTALGLPRAILQFGNILYKYWHFRLLNKARKNTLSTITLWAILVTLNYFTCLGIQGKGCQDIQILTFFVATIILNNSQIILFPVLHSFSFIFKYDKTLITKFSVWILTVHFSINSRLIWLLSSLTSSLNDWNESCR